MTTLNMSPQAFVNVRCNFFRYIGRGMRTLDVASRVPLAPCTSGCVGVGSPVGRVVCAWGGSILVT